MPPSVRSQRFVVACALAMVNCSGDSTCAIGSGSNTLVASVGDRGAIELEDWSAKRNDACLATGAPSMTIIAHQPIYDGSGTFPYTSGGRMTLCVPGAELAIGTLALGNAPSSSAAWITELRAMDTECYYNYDSSRVTSGALTTRCDDSGGLVIDATIPVTTTCGTDAIVDQTYATLQGTVPLESR